MVITGFHSIEEKIRSLFKNKDAAPSYKLFYSKPGPRVKKILEAEALSDKMINEARKKRDEIINSASGSSSLAIQKKISEASSEAAKLKAEYDKKLAEYTSDSEAECEKKIESIRHCIFCTAFLEIIRIG